MKFFIDTAKLSEIKEANDLGILDGVTTNPSLMAKEGITGHQNIINHYVEICNIVDGPVSAEVIATDFKGMVSEGEALARLHKNIVVKIPMTTEGIKAIKYFNNKNIKTNCTLVFSAGQALLAAKAGATYVSPFIGRIDDTGHDGMNLIAEIMETWANYPSITTKVLAASIRHPTHVLQCIQLGAHTATMPAKTFRQLMSHPLTDKGLAGFMKDWAEVEAAGNA